MPLPPRDPSLTYESIDDFTPGIFSQSRYTITGSNTALPSPLGSAQLSGTYRCICLPNGGLGPLPALQPIIAGTDLPIDTTAVQSPYIVTGIYANGPVTPSSGAAGGLDEIHLGIEYIYNNGTSNIRKWLWVRRDLFLSPPTTETIKAFVGTAAQAASPGPWAFNASPFISSRMSNTSPYTDPGIPVIATSWVSALDNTHFVSIFPSLASPSTTSYDDLLTTTNGIPLGYEGRLVIVTQQVSDHGANALYGTNELFDYTDPPNSNTFPSPLQQEIFAPENPSGIGTYHLVNMGQLLIIKHRDGGVLLMGDMNQPTVIRLPSIQATGALECFSASCSAGLVYISHYKGLWAWRGGDTSEKLSKQLDDDFYVPSTTQSVNGPRYGCWTFGDWVLVSNNWLYDTVTSSWWRIEDPSITSILQWSLGYENVAYGAVDSFSTPSSNVAYQFVGVTLANSYRWTGHPIRSTVNRFVECRELVLVAQGQGTVTITLTAADNSTQSFSFSVASASQPETFRKSIGVKGYNLIPQIDAVGAGSSGPAPVVYSLAVGVAQSQLVMGG